MKSVSRLAAFMCVFVLHGAPVFANQLRGDLSFDHVVALEDGSCSVAIRITNGNASSAAVFENIVVSSRYGEKSFGFNKRLAPADQHAFRVLMPCDFGSACLRFNFHWNGKRQLKTRSILLSPPVPPAYAWTSFLVPLAGLAGVMLGAVLTHRLTTSRERERAQQEWMKSQFLDGQPYLQQFVRDWGGQPNSILLADTFRQLEESCWVPSQVRSVYQSTVEVLQRSTSTNDREEACRSLINVIESYRKEPWAKGS